MCDKGNSRAAAGDVVGALACFEDAVRLDPGMAEAHCLRGRALSVLCRHKEAIASFRQAIRLKPGYAFGYAGIGNSLLRRGRPHKALKYLDNAIALNPGDMLAHSAKGDALCMLGRHGDAVACYDASISAGLTVVAYNGKGGALRALGDPEGGLRMYDRAVRLNPESADAHHGRAQCLADAGRRAEAIDACGRALKLDEDHEGARSTMDSLR